MAYFTGRKSLNNKRKRCFRSEKGSVPTRLLLERDYKRTLESCSNGKRISFKIEGAVQFFTRCIVHFPDFEKRTDFEACFFFSKKRPFGAS